MAEDKQIVISEGGNTSYPQGTRAEVLAKHMSPKVIPTCSQPVDGINLGCPFFDHKKFRCIFHATRNAEAGPEHFGFYKKLPSGAEQGFVLPCYLFMANEFEFWQQRHLTGVKYSRFYQVGEQMTRRLRVPRHPEVDPKCQKCRKGDCNLMDTVKQTTTIEAFRRPGEVIQDDIFPHDEQLPPDSGIALERQAEQHKPGSQVDQIMSQRKKERLQEERIRGTS